MDEASVLVHGLSDTSVPQQEGKGDKITAALETAFRKRMAKLLKGHGREVTFFA